MMKINPNEFNKKIGNILRDSRKAAGYTCAEVAPILTASGLPCKTSTINSWENGRTAVGGVQLLMLCHLYNIHDIYSVFLGKDSDNQLNRDGLTKLDEYRKILIASGMFKPSVKAEIIEFPKRREVPMYLMAVSAGTGEFLDDDNHDMIEIPESIPECINESDIDFAVHIHGNSMEPRFTDQQIIWVHKCTELSENDIGIFYLNGEAYCKKFHKTKKGISLISLNKDYNPISIRESDEFRIFGKVII